MHAPPRPKRKLLPKVTCPHCWTEFPVYDVRFISESATLLGDPMQGSEAHLRFLPSRFTFKGHALDPTGSVCMRMACPGCHFELPAAVLEQEQAVLSVVGAPSSGKSVMLAAATFALRSGLVVPGLDFLDVDPGLNDLSIGLEGTLFKSATPKSPTMIAKTEASGQLYRTYRCRDQRLTAPKPQLFGVARGRSRMLLSLYDNAGEHFLPGSSQPFEHVTRHLAVSKALILVLDPTQDPRVYDQLGGRESVADLGGSSGAGFRADLILIEVMNRVRRLRGLSSTEPLPCRVVVALSKHDLWGRLAPDLEEIVRATPAGSLLALPKAAELAAIHEASCGFLRRHVPEVLAAAKAADPGFRVVPFSGLGTPPSRDLDSGALLIRPADVRPTWAAGPLVLGLAEAMPTTLPEYLPVKP